ncbi:AAA family ATPase [Actinoplanes sp. NPDC048796]|uniref:AAA family ATPase n=1 Tax=Actinoplanes sp. NPDC048796 TaxID=3155640 RepID=UPI0033F314C3
MPEGTALRGRDELLATIESRLAAGGGVALHGPAGIGKTALLDAVANAAAARGELVVRLRPVRTEHSLPYAGISDLVTQLPEEAAAGLPPAQRAALAALRQGLPPRAGAPALARRLVLPLLLARAARRRPVLLILDDCQWLDAESAELIAFAMRRRPGPRVRAIAAQRRPDAPSPRPEPAHPGIRPAPPAQERPNTSPARLSRTHPDISPAALTRERRDILSGALARERPDISPGALAYEEPDILAAAPAYEQPDISSPALAHEQPDSSPGTLAHEQPDSSPGTLAHEQPDSSPAALAHEQPDSSPAALAHERPDSSPGAPACEHRDISSAVLTREHPDISTECSDREHSGNSPAGSVREGPDISSQRPGRGRSDISPARLSRERPDILPSQVGRDHLDLSPGELERERAGTSPSTAGRKRPAVSPARLGRENPGNPPALGGREQQDDLPARPEHERLAARASARGVGTSALRPGEAGTSALLRSEDGSSALLPGEAGNSALLPEEAGTSALLRGKAGNSALLPEEAESSALLPGEADSSALLRGEAGSSALPLGGGGALVVPVGGAGTSVVPGGGVRRLEGGGQRHRAARLCPAPVLELGVPPLSADDLTELLEARGLPCRIASRMHEASAGNPFLALTLGGAVAPGPAWRPAPLPEAAREMLGERLAALGPEVRRTLLTAALAVESTVTVLLRAGRDDAVRDLRHAAGAGVVRLDGEVVRFTPPLLATVLTEEAGAGERVEVHTALAAGAVDPVEALRHRALRSGRPDAAVARSLAAAADRCAERGAGRTAAELYLLAADRCPHTHSALRLDWLVAAARTALTSGAAALAGRAAEAVLAGGAPAGHRVRARVVLLDLAGQGLADMGETFAAALAEAGDDPALLAPVRLRLTWAAFLTGDPDAAEAEAGRTVAAARDAGDPTTEAMALSILAQIQRLRGEPGWPRTLRQALALPAAPAPDWLHYGPRYMAARFAMVDDRLDEARDELLKLLVVAEQDRIGEARVEVLRSLSEVATRAGRCREALRYAHRAVRAAQRAGLSPGPTWHTAAVAELAGGSLAAATGFARRGVRASEQEGDTLYLRRNLHALGQAELRAGQTRAGVAALLRLRELEAESGGADPMIVRWHGDLAGGLAALGEHAEAAAMLAEARAAAHRLGDHPGLSGYLDRATAVVLSESGQAESAVRLSAAAAQHFAQLHQPIEQAHALLVQGSAERRRRRYAAARVAIGAALAIFLAADAKPWAEQTERALARTESNSAPLDLGLTSTELRIAALVRDGSSNREIASRLFLSVKTVEATLTRVYRKLGVRSRTQLSSRLPSVAEFTSNV